MRTAREKRSRFAGAANVGQRHPENCGVGAPGSPATCWLPSGVSPVRRLAVPDVLQNVRQHGPIGRIWLWSSPEAVNIGRLSSRDGCSGFFRC